MRIPSEQKILMQAKMYAARHPVTMPAAWEKEYAKLNQKHVRLSEKFFEFTKDCPSFMGRESSHKCTCKEKEGYEEVFGELNASAEVINAMYGEKAALERALYNNFLYMLRVTKENKNGEKQMITKTTVGFVVQNFDDDGKFINQAFIAGDQVDWENEEGDPIEEPANVEYIPFEMKQPESEEAECMPLGDRRE